MMALVGKRERPMKRLFKAAGEREHSRSSSSNVPQDKRYQTAEFPEATAGCRVLHHQRRDAAPVGHFGSSLLGR
jgi:hypothetical protein